MTDLAVGDQVFLWMKFGRDSHRLKCANCKKFMTGTVCNACGMRYRYLDGSTFEVLGLTLPEVEPTPWIPATLRTRISDG